MAEAAPSVVALDVLRQREWDSNKGPSGSHRGAPGPGRPYEFEGGEPQFAYVSRTLDVNKQQFAAFLASSRGRRNSGLFTAFLQPRDETEDLEATRALEQHRSILGIRMISPYNVLAGIWSVFLTTVDASYTAFLVPIILAFKGGEGLGQWSRVVEIIAGFVFLLDIFMNFHIGFIVRYDYKKKVVMDSTSVALFYATHGGLWIDVLSVVPLFFEIAVLLSDETDGTTAITIFLRMFRLVRLIRLMQRIYITAFSGKVRRSSMLQYISSTWIYLLSVVYTLALMINALGCLLYFTARIENDDFEGTWLEKHWQPSHAENYLTSVYWAVTTVTTVGYGDISPQTWEEQIIIMFLMVTHIMLFGLLIGSMSELVKSSTQKAKAAEHYKEKMASVGEWLKSRQVSKTMAKKVNAYYAEIWVRNTNFDEDTILSELPTSLRGEIVFNITRHLLQGLSVFKDVDVTALVQLAGRMVPIDLPPGHEQVRQGDPADSIFILEDGTLIVLQDEYEVERLKGPTTCCESAILASDIPELRKRPITLRARTACHMWELKVKDMEHLFSSYPTLKETLTEGYRVSMVTRFNRQSLKPAALEDKVEAELGADLSGHEALDFRRQLCETNVADGTFPRLMKATLRRSRMIRGSENGRITMASPTDPEDTLSVSSPLSPQTPILNITEPRNIIHHLLLTLRANGVNGMLEFTERVKAWKGGSNGPQGGSLSDFANLLKDFDLKPRQVTALFSHLDPSDSGMVDPSKLIDLIRFATISARRQHVLIRIFEKLDVDMTGTVDVMELVKGFQVGFHRDVQSRMRTRTEVVMMMLRAFNGVDWVTMEDFLMFNMDMSICTQDTDTFIEMVCDLWNVCDV
ncbi:hypothetical protein BSKO_01365 [Bryopsis sp. KO-2023]|nr:hypothetical protein BSKO_01365 [Bryopsis sp. KO-2023]